VRETRAVGATSNRLGTTAETPRETATRVVVEPVRRSGIGPKELGRTFPAGDPGVVEPPVHVDPLIHRRLGTADGPYAYVARLDGRDWITVWMSTGRSGTDIAAGHPVCSSPNRRPGVPLGRGSVASGGG
jgi:hypothetical protein